MHGVRRDTRKLEYGLGTVLSPGRRTRQNASSGVRAAVGVSFISMFACWHVASVIAVQRPVWSWRKTGSNRTTVKMALVTQGGHRFDPPNRTGIARVVRGCEAPTALHEMVRELLG